MCNERSTCLLKKRKAECVLLKSPGDSFRASPRPFSASIGAFEGNQWPGADFFSSTYQLLLLLSRRRWRDNIDNVFWLIHLSFQKSHQKFWIQHFDFACSNKVNKSRTQSSYHRKARREFRIFLYSYVWEWMGRLYVQLNPFLRIRLPSNPYSPLLRNRHIVFFSKFSEFNNYPTKDIERAHSRLPKACYRFENYP